MKIALTTDHAGFEMLQQIRNVLTEQGHECIDFGPKTFVVDDDYPDFIFPAASAVATGQCERAIIMGGSGQGEAIAANRFRRVRCALFYAPAVARQPIDAAGTMSSDPYEIVRLSRQHNDSNVLSLSGRFLTTAEALEAIAIWLSEPFSGQERHARRIRKLSDEGAA